MLKEAIDVLLIDDDTQTAHEMEHFLAQQRDIHKVDCACSVREAMEYCSLCSYDTVSYTHLDVYKRQTLDYMDYAYYLKFQQIISKMQGEGKSFLYVTSKFEDIFKLSDRISFLSKGRISGTYLAEEVKKDPTKTAVSYTHLDVYKRQAIFVSSEISELVAACDRIFILNRGKICAELSGKEIENEEVIQNEIQQYKSQKVV